MSDFDGGQMPCYVAHVCILPNFTNLMGKIGMGLWRHHERPPSCPKMKQTTLASALDSEFPGFTIYLFPSDGKDVHFPAKKKGTVSFFFFFSWASNEVFRRK